MRKIKTDTPTQCMIYKNSACSSKYVLDYFQTDIPWGHSHITLWSRRGGGG